MIGWVFATACAIAAAALGAGAWALVLQQVVLAAVTAAVFILAARWRPSLEFSRNCHPVSVEVRLSATPGASVFFVLQQLVTALLIGHLVGIEALGIWNLSMALVFVPLSLPAYPSRG